MQEYAGREITLRQPTRVSPLRPELVGQMPLGHISHSEHHVLLLSAMLQGVAWVMIAVFSRVHP